VKSTSGANSVTKNLNFTSFKIRYTFYKITGEGLITGRNETRTEINKLIT